MAQGRSTTIISMLQWTRTSRLSIKISLSLGFCGIQSVSQPGSCFIQDYTSHCRVNVAHIRQSRPDSGLGVRIKVLQTFGVVALSLGSGRPTPGTHMVAAGRWLGLKKGNSNPHGARPVHPIVTMMKWIRTRTLSIKNSLCDTRRG